jgi:hypothetical protein
VIGPEAVWACASEVADAAGRGYAEWTVSRTERLHCTASRIGPSNSPAAFHPMSSQPTKAVDPTPPPTVGQEAQSGTAWRVFALAVPAG